MSQDLIPTSTNTNAASSFTSHDSLPLLSLLTNFIRKSQDEFFELIESLSGNVQDEYQRRKKMFVYFTNKQKQYSQVYAIIKWTNQNHIYLDRLQLLSSILERRISILDHTCETLQILQRRVEDRLYPLWDIYTALHVMSTGTYRLLPGIIETRLIEEYSNTNTSANTAAGAKKNPLKPQITEEVIQSTLARLNNTLHIRLLSTPLPIDLTHIDVRDGIAYLTYGEEFELGVSLRMSPEMNAEQMTQQEILEREETRIHWRLYELKILMNVDQQTSLTSDLHRHSSLAPLFNESQLLHLNVLLNTIASSNPNPLMSMCDTLHSLCITVCMDILYQQSVTLTKVFAMQDILVEFSNANAVSDKTSQSSSAASTNKILNIKYWKEMKEIPMEGSSGTSNGSSATNKNPRQHPLSLQAPSTPSTSSTTSSTAASSSQLLSPCLQILVDDKNRLSIRHNPPLDCTEYPSLLTLNLSALSLTHLLANVQQYHGNKRLEELYALLKRECVEKKRVVAMEDMEVRKRREDEDGAEQQQDDEKKQDYAHESELQSRLKGLDIKTSTTKHSPHFPARTVVQRCYLYIRLLPGYIIRIHTDTQSGRFVMEWSHAHGEKQNSAQQNLTAFYGGTSSLLNRILHSECARLNSSIGSAFEIILHLRMMCLTHQLATAASRASNSRLRVYITTPPFACQPAHGASTAASIMHALKHTVYDATHWKAYTYPSAVAMTPSAVAGNELFRRPGFGPYTVYLQLAGYSTAYFIAFQLNPFTQLQPVCALIHTEHEVTRSVVVPPASNSSAVSTTSSSSAPPPVTSSKPNPFPVIRQLNELKWPSAIHTSDPSVGFTSEENQLAFSSLIHDGETLVPLLILRRDFQLNFPFLIRELQIVSSASPPPSSAVANAIQALPECLKHVIAQRGLQAKLAMMNDSTSASQYSPPPVPPHMLLSLNYPLNYSLYPSSNISMDIVLDPSNPQMMKSEAHAVIFTTPPELLRDVSSHSTAPAQSSSQPSHSTAPGFIVYFYHPLIQKIFTSLQESENNAMKSSTWQKLIQSGRLPSLPSAITSGDSSLAASSGVLTFLYEGLTTSRVARFIYDLDNLWIHLSWLSNVVKQNEVAILNQLVSGLTEDGLSGENGGMMLDEVVEHVVDGTSSQLAQAGSQSSQSSVLSLVIPGGQSSKSSSFSSSGPLSFPPEFYRLIEFNSTQITFAYVNPDSTTNTTHPLCQIILTRDHRRELWKRQHLMQTHMYPSSGGQPKSLLPQDAPNGVNSPDYRITLLPHAWPQLPFLTMDFLGTRQNNILTLLHHIYIAHRTMPSIWRFLNDVNKWQCQADLTNNHQLLRLFGAHSGSRLHCFAESSTRLRLLYGQLDRGKIHENMWRMKTDLRLIYEGEVVQDFKAGTSIGGGGQRQGNSGMEGGSDQQSSPSHPQSSSSSQLVRPGKIRGDLTTYLHRWYKHLASDEYKSVLKNIERSLKNGEGILPGIKFESVDVVDGDLGKTFVKMVFPPVQNQPAENQLTTAEQHVLSSYFAYRLASPPYFTEPYFMFSKLFLSTQANVPIVVGAIKQVIEVWAMELIQQYPFPTPFPQPFDESVVRVLVMQGKQKFSMNGASSASSSTSPAPLAFRFVLQHKPVFDMSFSAETKMFACTVEVCETQFTREYHASHASTQTNGHGGTAGMNGHHSSHHPHPHMRSRPYALFLPLAYNMSLGTLARWEVPNRVIGNTQKKFTPLPTSSSSALPATFVSFAHAMNTLLHATMDQLVEWFTAPMTQQQQSHATNNTAATISTSSSLQQQQQHQHHQQSLQAPTTEQQPTKEAMRNMSAQFFPSTH